MISGQRSAGDAVPAQPPGTKQEQTHLLQGAADLREHVVGIGADQTHRPDNNDQNYGQHYRVFGNVLTLFVLPMLSPHFERNEPGFDGEPESPA